MMTSSKSSYHHGNLRAELLMHALDILDTEGIDAVTIRAVARNAGVAHSAPVNHYPNKQALLTTLAATIFDSLADEVSDALQAVSSSHPERIRVFADTVIEFALNHPNRYRLLWRRDRLDDAHEGLQTAMDRIYKQLIDTLAENRTHKSTSVETRAIALWSMIHGYVIMRLDGNLIEKADELTGLPRRKAIIDSIMEGIETVE